MDQIVQVPLEKHAAPPAVPEEKVPTINRRRWENFKRHRRGYWSMWIFMILFVLSLFAELIANNKPFLVSYDGKWHYPIFQFYPETAFGGEFETEANYRDPEVQRLIKEKNGYVLWPLIPFHHSTINYDVPTPAPSKPTWMYTEDECKAAAAKKGAAGCSGLDQNWLGTDTAARDVTARLI
jgi:microcin C transport system permease protein